MSCSIGIGITTHSRPGVLAKALEQWRRFLPDGAKLVVVDDASEPAAEADYRFDENAGIPRAKNKCLEMLDGCEHVFLADDDCWPIADEWWKPYVESPEPHLGYQFLDLAGPRKLHDITEVHRDETHVAYSDQRGCLLYYHRSALDAVGGFDPIYGRGMYEHGDLADRIHSAGLTTWRYADVVGSEKLWHSMDEHEEVDRSIPKEDRRDLVSANRDRHHKRRAERFAGYVEYRQPDRSGLNVVITTLLTSRPDPQRGVKWDPTPDLLEAWSASVKGAQCLVLADELETAPRNVDVVRVPDVDDNVYMRRWMHIYQHLRAHPEYGFVWITDGTDVTMLREPWADMDPTKLYLGSEPSMLAIPWMMANHPAQRYQKFMRTNRNKKLLNAGLVGGDRTTVMKFAQDMVTEAHDLKAARFWRNEPKGAEIGDMAAFNLVAYTRWASRIVTGPTVHTVFRSRSDNGTAWWQHK
jgi:hypothetical protein